MIKCGRTLWHLPIAPEASKHCPPDLGAEHDRRRVQSRRLRHDAHRQAGQQLRGREAAVYRAQGLARAQRRRARGQRLACAIRCSTISSSAQAAQDRDPFLIYFGFSHPHDPRNGTPELLAKYGATNHDDPNTLPAANPKQPPLPANYLPAHPFPTTLLPDQRDETQVSGVWKNRDERTIRNELGRYFACSENIDHADRPRACKSSKRWASWRTRTSSTRPTTASPSAGMACRESRTSINTRWRVPFIVKGPGIKPGSRVRETFTCSMCLATLCDLAGIRRAGNERGHQLQARSGRPARDDSRCALRRSLRRHQARHAVREDRATGS